MTHRSRLPLLASALILCTPALAPAETFPKAGSEPDYPLASLLGEPGGKLSQYDAQYPKSFNYSIENSINTREMFDMMFEEILQMDELTYELLPGLANKWEISDDKLQYTFHMNPKAKWSDGKPVTADDAVYTFNALKNPEHLTGPWQAMLSKLKTAEKIDDLTFRITASEVHWLNLGYAASIRVLPKHWWEKQDFNKVNFEFPVVSGPYKLGEVKEPSYARLKKRPDYWNADSPQMEGYLNFDEIELRYYDVRNNAFEAFKKGEFDLFAVYTSSRWVKETVGERFEKNWIVKQAVQNNQPLGFQGFAMNMRRAPFDDKRVRQAIAHLVDRKRMNNDLMFNQYTLSNSFYPDIYDEEHPNTNPHFEFDVPKARALLAEAGWKVDPKDGKLKKDGKEFVLKFLTRTPTTTKFLLIMDEALKDVGITLEIDQKDWSGWSRDMDEYNFDITMAPWGSVPVPYKNAENMWHTMHKDAKSGNNYSGLSNPKIDKLIENMRTEFDVNKRVVALREIDKLIVEEVPYVLLWNVEYTRLLYWNKHGVADHVLGGYFREWGAKYHWWADPDQAADLEAAMKSGDPMPAAPKRVNLGDVLTVEGVIEPLN